MDDLLREFLTETNESIDVIDRELVRFEQEPNNAKILDRIFRLVHTIKGTCGFLDLPRLEALTHAAEALMDRFRAGAPVTPEAVTLILSTIDRIKKLLGSIERLQAEEAGNDEDLIWMLDQMVDTIEPIPSVDPEDASIPESVYEKARAILAKNAPAIRADASARDDDRDDGGVASQSIRVHVETLEHLMIMVSELVLTRNQLLEIVRRHEDSEFQAPLQRLSNVTAELQDSVMKARMQPVGNAWQKLPRVVRDLSTDLGKPIAFEMRGAETELDRQVLELIKDPLTHMVRNACDHGLEMPAERRAMGKPEKGSLRLSAWHQGGQIVIEVVDDGRGLDTERIREAALLKGLVSASDIDKMSDSQIQQFIFSPGFSTAAQVTSVSGRGVGLDVVRSNIDQIGGAIDVQSVRGRGTAFTIRIPLTLAIVSTLIVEAGGERFAIPQVAVAELVRVRSHSEHRIERIKDATLLRLRNKLLPLVQLKTLLGLDRNEAFEADTGFVVVTQVGSRTFGILVDGVFHTEEIVVKPMSSKLRNISVFSGNTILGDGSVIMIIDPTGVAQTIGGISGPQVPVAEENDRGRSDERASAEPMLVFRAGSARPKAVLLALITRLEEVDVRAIEMSDGRPVVQYRGQLMPLVPANDEVRLKESGQQPLLLFGDEGRTMALIIDEIVDIVEQELEIELVSSRPGILGSAVIAGQATEVLDVTYFLPLGFEDWEDWKERRERARQRRVLLVDDATSVRNMLVAVLKAAGYATTSVASAQEALALLMGGALFDAVVTDVDMPGMDGFALAAALRHDLRTAAIPIIGLLPYASVDLISRGREAGFHDYAVKFDRQGLITALRAQIATIGRAA